jgi:hypothetical protein
VGSYQGSISKSIIFGLLVFSFAFSASAESYVYQPKFRSADELRESVLPFLESGGKAGSVNGKIVITGSLEKIEEIKAILAEIDKGARQLIVQVRSKGKKQAETESVEVQDPSTDPKIAGGAVSEKTALKALQGFTISEGADAFIATEDGGFNAIVHVTGKMVVLDIYQKSRREKKNGVSHTYNALKTSVHGQLDEWIELGKLETSHESKSRYTIGAADSHESSGSEVSIRVRLAK